MLQTIKLTHPTTAIGSTTIHITYFHTRFDLNTRGMISCTKHMANLVLEYLGMVCGRSPDWKAPIHVVLTEAQDELLPKKPKQNRLQSLGIGDSLPDFVWLCWGS